jgi:NitT/TauT family transport system substrate-binding protein
MRIKDLLKTTATSAVLAIYGYVGQVAAQPINISVGVRDPIYAHLYIAYVKGYFQDQGLQPRLVVTGSGSRTAQLLATGQADVVMGNPEHVLVITNEGRATVMLAAVDQRNTFGNILVHEDSDIKTFADLKGKSVGITATGGGAYYYANYLFMRNGLKKEDFTWLNLGSVANMQGALRAKRAAAVVASLSMIETAKTEKNGRVIFDSRDTAAWDKIFKGPMPSSVIYALSANVDKNPELYKKFTRAVVKADQFIRINTAAVIAEAIGPEMGGQSIPSLTHAIGEYKGVYWRANGLRISQQEFERWQGFVIDSGLMTEADKSKYGYGQLVRDVGAFTP